MAAARATRAHVHALGGRWREGAPAGATAEGAAEGEGAPRVLPLAAAAARAGGRAMPPRPSAPAARARGRGAKRAREEDAASTPVAAGTEAASSGVELSPSLSKAITCPISLTLFHDPVVLAGSGITYSRLEITRWLRKHNTCPVSNRKLNGASDRLLVPNIALRALAEEEFIRRDPPELGGAAGKEGAAEALAALRHPRASAATCERAWQLLANDSFGAAEMGALSTIAAALRTLGAAAADTAKGDGESAKAAAARVAEGRERHLRATWRAQRIVRKIFGKGSAKHNVVFDVDASAVVESGLVGALCDALGEHTEMSTDVLNQAGDATLEGADKRAQVKEGMYTCVAMWADSALYYLMWADEIVHEALRRGIVARLEQWPLACHGRAAFGLSKASLGRGALLASAPFNAALRENPQRPEGVDSDIDRTRRRLEHKGPAKVWKVGAYNRRGDALAGFRDEYDPHEDEDEDEDEDRYDAEDDGRVMSDAYTTDDYNDSDDAMSSSDDDGDYSDDEPRAHEWPGWLTAGPSHH